MSKIIEIAKCIEIAVILVAVELTLLLAGLSATGPVRAQGQASAKTGPCTQEELLNKTGNWKKGQDNIRPGKNYNPDMQPEIFSRLEKISKLIQQAHPLRGMEATCERQIYGNPPAKSGTVTYGLWGQLLEYRCDSRTNQPAPEDESNDHFSVLINHFGSYFFYDSSIHAGRYFVALMPLRIGSIKGADLFRASPERDNEHFIFITREGRLPYIPLTQKQYLLALKDKFQRRADDFQLKRIDNYLANTSEAILGQAALVKDMQGFSRFYTEKEGGRMPVIVNADYFNPTEKPYFPQFILVSWQWNDGQGPGGGLLKPVPPDMDACCKVAKYYKDSMEQNLDLNAFRAMLDK